MKKILSIIGALLITVTIWAQSPEKMSYQAVIRDASQQLIVDQSVGMQISVLQGGASGVPVYVETQIPTTNTNGLITVEIGAGSVVEGIFVEIGWLEGPYFIKIEIDPEGGSNYTITGVSQLLSVPFALHAKTAETVENITIVGDEEVFDTWDKDTSDDFTGDYNDLENLPLNIDEDKLDDVTLTGDQTIAGTKTFIGVIAVPTPVNDTDAATKAYVDALETRLNVLELKFELSEGAVVSDLVDDGASASDLLAAGTSVSDLLAAGVSVSDLVDGGASVSDLLAAGVSVSDLLAAGVSVSDLVDGGALVSDLLVAGVSVSDLLAAGVSVSDLLTAGVSVSDLLAAGVTTDEFVGVYYEAEGGIIFYVDESDGSGLVCAVSDYSENVVWSDANLDVSTENGIGSGQANTLAIIAAQGDLTSSGENYAAQICNDLVLNSYDDWFLPSLDEVDLIITNKTKINETSLLEGGAEFTENWMWTSSQYSIDRAYIKRSYVSNKEYTQNVRAVRAF